MTTPPLDEAKARAAATYNAASDHYDDEANVFWERFGRRTVERLQLASGAHVLDVCCGSGASALPAASAAGPTGSVLGVDLAENMLALARAKARFGLRLSRVRVRPSFEHVLTHRRYQFRAIAAQGSEAAVDHERAYIELRWVAPGELGRMGLSAWARRVLEGADER